MEPLFEKFLHKINSCTLTDDSELKSDLNLDKEFSYSKLYTRLFFLLVSILYCFLSQSETTFYIYCYFSGYFLVSVLVQYYSLTNYSIKHNSEIPDSETPDSDKKSI